jgi:hypothetical protein
VQARLGDLHALGDVGVAEAVEAARLHEALGDVEDALRGVVGPWWQIRDLPTGLTSYLTTGK